jgi:hypothetical protein
MSAFKPKLKDAFLTEIAAARSAEAIGDASLAKYHLERAHILGQRWYMAHIKTHYYMLRLALKRSDKQEARGQLLRLIGAAPFHIAGWIPVGNTGGADVSPTMPMPIPVEFQPYFADYPLKMGLILRGIVLALFAAACLLYKY